jgi:hypothetical protein
MLVADKVMKLATASSTFLGADLLLTTEWGQGGAAGYDLSEVYVAYCTLYILVVDNASKAGPGGHRFILELSLYRSLLCVHLCRFGRRVDGRELGCADVADVAATVRPRYHFAATHGVGFQAIEHPNG